MKVSELADGYVTARLSGQEVVQATAEGMRYNLRSFAISIDDPEVAELAREHIEQWRRSAKLSTATLRNRLSQFRSFCEWATQYGHIARNPMLGVRPPRKTRTVPRGLRLAEIEAVLDACPDARARLVILLMTQEGLRRKEVVGLTFGDVDLAERLILVVGKGGHERVLPISDETMAALGTYLRQWPAVAGPLIRSYHDGRSAIGGNYLGHQVVEWMIAAGIKQAARDGRACHSCRHTMATDMIRAGANLRDIQAALGHKSLETTQIYLPWRVGDLRVAMGGRCYQKSADEQREDETA